MLPELFQSAPEQAIAKRQITKGGLAFHQETKTRGLFFVSAGKIELRRTTETGGLVTVHRAQSGETFAEASLFSDAYHCDAIAVIDTTLIELERSYVLNHLQTDPDFAIAMTKHLAKQNQFYRRKIEILAIKNATERVYSALSDKLLQSDIISFASEIGLTHEAVYRSLRALVNQRRVTQTGRGKYSVN